MNIEVASGRGKGDGTDVIPMDPCGAVLDSPTFGVVKCRKRPGHKGLHKWWNHGGRSTIWTAAPKPDEAA